MQATVLLIYPQTCHAALPQLYPRTTHRSNMFLLWSILLLITTASTAANLTYTHRDGTDYTTFTHTLTGATLEFVNNSGICETTPNVNQYSGYLSVGKGLNIFFWFFESRSTPTTAPLATWFNGGPGCSSMIGLFQENGPCHFPLHSDTDTPVRNPYSFNEVANMLYIDQPVSVGFSYADDSTGGGGAEVNSTDAAAGYVWVFLQAFFEAFHGYQGRDVAIFTESYGGHYGPSFASHIQAQNELIHNGSLSGEIINLVALAINNAWIDTAIQEKAYIDFAYNNTYRSLISESQRDNYLSAYEKTCLPAVTKCTEAETDESCRVANRICSSQIEGPISRAADFNVYDIRKPKNDNEPPSTYMSYLNREDVRRSIGARGERFRECAGGVSLDFARTGDNAKTLLPTVSKLIESGLQVLLWAGDADWICNWIGNYDVANAVTFKGAEEFRGKELVPYTVDGVERGMVKSVGGFTFLRVFGAGHEVPYYQPETSLQVFRQVLEGRGVYST